MSNIQVARPNTVAAGTILNKTNLYTCPKNTSFIMHSCFLCNISPTKVDVTINISVFLSDIQLEIPIITNVLIPYGSTISFTRPLSCNDDDVIIGWTDNPGSVDYMICGQIRRNNLNVTPNYITRSGKPITTANEKLITVPTNYNIRIFSLYIALLDDSTDTTVSIMYKSALSNGSTTYLFKDMAILKDENYSGTFQAISNPIDLLENDELYVICNKNNSITVFLSIDKILLS